MEDKLKRFTNIHELDLIINKIEILESEIYSKSSIDCLTDDIEILTDYLFYLQLYNELKQYTYSFRK